MSSLEINLYLLPVIIKYLKFVVTVATVTCDEKEMRLNLAEKGSFETIRLNEKGILFVNL